MVRARRHQAGLATTTYDTALEAAGAACPIQLGDPDDQDGHGKYLRGITEETRVSEVVPGLMRVRTVIAWQDVSTGGTARRVEVERLLCDPAHALKARTVLSEVNQMRRGMTLVELFFAVVVGFLLMGMGLHLVLGARRGEMRTGQSVDAAEEVARAAGWILHDLSALDHPPAEPPVTVDAWDGVPETRMRFRVRKGDAGVSVTYRPEQQRGELVRLAEPGEARRFRLGPGAGVLFRKVDPSFAGGGTVQLGAFNNRLVYRITARRDGPLGQLKLHAGGRSAVPREGIAGHLPVLERGRAHAAVVSGALARARRPSA